MWWTLSVTVAHADPNGFVEVQFPADQLLDAFTSSLRARSAWCPGVETDDDFELNDVDTLVDHFVVGDLGGWSLGAATTISPYDIGNLTVHPIQLEVPVEVAFEPLSCATDPTCPVQSESRTLSFTLHAAGYDDLEEHFCLEVAPGPAGESDVDQAIRGYVGQRLNTCTDLYLGNLLAFATPQSTYSEWTVHDPLISADGGLDRIAFRSPVSVDGGDQSQADWQAYANGALGPSGPGTTVFVDGAVAEHGFSKTLYRKIECSDESEDGSGYVPSEGCSDGISFEVQHDGILETLPSYGGNVDDTWSGGDPAFVSDFAHLTTDDCPASDDPFDVAVSYTLVGDELQVTADFGWPDDETCAQDPLPGRISSTMNAQLAGHTSTSGCTTSGSSLTCAFPTLVPPMTFTEGGANIGLFHATAATVDSAGIRFDLSSSLSTSPAIELLSLDGVTPTEQVLGSCRDLHVGYAGWVDVLGGRAPYCSEPGTGGPAAPYLVDDALGVYSLGASNATFEDEVEIDLDASGGLPAYGPSITVWSGVGSRTVTLDPPVAGDAFRVAFQYIRAWAACQRAIDPATHLKTFPPWWLVDPPPYEVSIVGDDVWGSSAKAEIVAADLRVDSEVAVARDGTLTVDRATLLTTWSVDGGKAGKFEFEAETPTGKLVGARSGKFDVFALTAPIDAQVSALAESLPKGVRSAMTKLYLTPTDLVWQSEAR